MVAKEKRKETDYSEYPLTNHGDMLMALVQSGISRYPNRAVVMQFFETAARYGDFFKIRKECIMPTLEAFVDPRQVDHDCAYEPITHGSIRIGVYITKTPPSVQEYSICSIGSSKTEEMIYHQIYP